MKGDFTISLIIPCYNEEKNIQKGVLDRIGNYTKTHPLFSEVIIVDDGSSDSSKTTIRERYLKTYPKFLLIESNHLGKAYAIIKGIREAHGNFVMFSDIDLATPIEEANKLIAKIKEGYQIVIGSRNIQREGAPILRKIMSLGSIVVRNLIIGIKNITDTQCGFKVFKKDIAIKIIDKFKVFNKRKSIKGSSVSAGFDLEFIFLAQKLGFKIKEVPVIWRYAETKNVNFLKDSFESLIDILKIKYFDITGTYQL